MKILLIHPQARMHQREAGLYGRALRYAPTTMPTLAALVPPALGCEIRVLDEMVETVDFDQPADLVGLTGITGTINRAYEIADRFRTRGATVVLGGVHATVLPDEAAAHADALVLGYAEDAWPELLRDFSAGRMRARYGAAGGASRVVPPDRRHIKRSAYMQPDTVELTRGCGNECEYCASRSLCPSTVSRKADEVLEEIAGLPGRMISFLDPNLMTDLPLAREFFAGLRGLKKWWVGCVTVEIKEHPDLLDLMAASGCKGLLIGFESVNQAALDGAGKRFGRVSEYGPLVKILHRRGIIVEGCFVLGFDADAPSVFGDTFEFVASAGIDYVHYTLFTPFPGTDAYRRLEGERRILSRDWSLYNGRRVVFQPKRMTAGALAEGFSRLWGETYRLPAIMRRLSGPPFLTKPLVFASNVQSSRFQERAAALDA